MSGHDTFDDVINGVNGIFGTDTAALDQGLKKHDSVQAKATATALVLQLNCQGCGKPTLLGVEWPELVAMKYGVNPAIAFRNHPGILVDATRWEFLPDEQAWRPEMKCRNCGFNVPIRIDANGEPERHLAVARRRGFIRPAGEKQVAMIAAQVAAGGQAVRR